MACLGRVVKVEDTSSNSQPCPTVHWVPAKIDYNGPANVQQYFDSSIKEELNGKMKCSFRGRPLDGCELDLPVGYSINILQEKSAAVGEDRCMQIKNKTNKVMYWNWDKQTSNNDPIVKAIQFIKIAQVLDDEDD